FAVNRRGQHSSALTFNLCAALKSSQYFPIHPVVSRFFWFFCSSHIAVLPKENAKGFCNFSRFSIAKRVYFCYTYTVPL
ncbi:MAG: hypothetical protein LBQ33_01965, partial [Oscillospiraceae bacterium]|nr:hypothetical protein [Oscillospiraceae bacterium]